MTNLRDAIIAGLLIGAAHGMTVPPVQAQSTITAWYDVQCVYLDEQYSQCDTVGGVSGELLETTYWDRSTGDHYYEDPRQ